MDNEEAQDLQELVNLALANSRSEGCNCCPEISVEVVETAEQAWDLNTGRTFAVVIKHDEDCIWLKIAAAPWN